MSTKNVRKDGKIIKYMKFPIRILARARDFYVNSMMGCAGQLGHSSAMGCSAPQFSTLPRSFSVNSSFSNASDEDMRELIRIASTRSLTGKLESELLNSKSSPFHGGGEVAAVPRSYTVTIGRIDEDKPCEFGGNEDVGLKAEFYPRSRSYAASRRGKVV